MWLSIKECICVTLLVLACDANEKVNCRDMRLKSSQRTAKPPNGKGYFGSIQEFERRKLALSVPILKVGVRNGTHVIVSLNNSNTSIKQALTARPVQFVMLTHDDITILTLYPNDGPLLLQHDASKLIVLYSNEKGVSRPVLYDNLLLAHIQKQLRVNPWIFPTRIRKHLLSNYFDFVRDGYVNIQTALTLTSYLDQEMDASVWGSFTLDFIQIYEKFATHVDFPRLQKYISSKTESILNSIGMEIPTITEDHDHSTDTQSYSSNDALRGALLYWNCKTDSKLCEDYAKTTFAKWKTNPTMKPDLHIRPEVFGIPDNQPLLCKIMEVGGREAYNFAHEIFKNYSDYSLLSRVGCLRDNVVISDVFDNILKTSKWKYPNHPMNTLVSLGHYNPAFRQDILDFLNVNFNYLFETHFIGIARTGFAKVIETVASSGTRTQEELAELEQFIEDHWEQFTPQMWILKSIVSWTRENIVWMEKNSNDIANWLKMQNEFETKLSKCERYL